ncbi:MAG: hypothetical protein M1824_003705 [Vezdaea acicularis]|nr:MAG: hypothetical protein M1824_003705 [Vezdaea acicularis]
MHEKSRKADLCVSLDDEGSSPFSPPPNPKSIVFDLYNDEIGPVHVDMSASAPIAPPHREVDKSIATKNTDRGIVDNQSAKLESYVINTLDLTSCSSRSAHQNWTRPPKKWNKVLWWKKLNPDTQTTEEKGVMVELEALGRRSRWTRYKRKMNITKILENHRPPTRHSKE